MNTDANDSGLPVGDSGNSGTVPQNLALNHCYQGGNTGFWMNDPCNAFDGAVNSVTGPGKTWDAAQGTLAVDFGKSQTITKLVITYESNSDPNPGYTVESSSDGQTWSNVKDVSNPSFVDTQTDLNVSGQYVRVRGKHFYFDPWWMHSVSEIEMWGTSDGHDP